MSHVNNFLVKVGRAPTEGRQTVTTKTTIEHIGADNPPISSVQTHSAKVQEDVAIIEATAKALIRLSQEFGDRAGEAIILTPLAGLDKVEAEAGKKKHELVNLSINELRTHLIDVQRAIKKLNRTSSKNTLEQRIEALETEKTARGKNPDHDRDLRRYIWYIKAANGKSEGSKGRATKLSHAQDLLDQTESSVLLDYVQVNDQLTEAKALLAEHLALNARHSEITTAINKARTRKKPQAAKPKDPLKAAKDELRQAYQRATSAGLTLHFAQLNGFQNVLTPEEGVALELPRRRKPKPKAPSASKKAAEKRAAREARRNSPEAIANREQKRAKQNAAAYRKMARQQAAIHDRNALVRAVREAHERGEDYHSPSSSTNHAKYIAPVDVYLAAHPYSATKHARSALRKSLERAKAKEIQNARDDFKLSPDEADRAIALYRQARASHRGASAANISDLQEANKVVLNEKIHNDPILRERIIRAYKRVRAAYKSNDVVGFAWQASASDRKTQRVSNIYARPDKKIALVNALIDCLDTLDLPEGARVAVYARAPVLQDIIDSPIRRTHFFDGLDEQHDPQGIKRVLDTLLDRYHITVATDDEISAPKVKNTLTSLNHRAEKDVAQAAENVQLDLATDHGEEDKAALAAQAAKETKPKNPERRPHLPRGNGMYPSQQPH